jgi:hypothetical protein
MSGSVPGITFLLWSCRARDFFFNAFCYTDSVENIQIFAVFADDPH